MGGTGATGAAGSIGPTGPQGVKGDRGDTGAQGPAVTVPLAGDYDVSLGVGIKLHNRNDLAQAGVAVGNTTPGDPQVIALAEDSGTAWAGGQRRVPGRTTVRLTGVAAGAVVKARYYANVSDANLSFRDRQLRVVPVRVG
jgi:hypothetical protein